MGTRSRIGIELPDHSVVSVYCHWDGYPTGNGQILVQHYLNREDVQELIDGGGISSLRTRGDWNHSSALRDESGEYISDVSDNCGEEYAYLYDLNDNWKAYKINYKAPVELVEIPNYVTA
jgi:hypothetical protein